MNFYIKSSEPKIDHPSRDPNYERAVAKGRKRAETMTFESEGQRRDYERAIRRNDHNVYGLPEFFPPENARVSYNEIHFESDEPDPRDFAKPRCIDLYCDNSLCSSITSHWISNVQCFCSKCGTQKPYHY